MKHYYETTHTDGGQFPISTAHDTFEEAAAFAEAHGIATIYEVGGNWGEFEKCQWCGEWFTLYELEKGVCSQCAAALQSRGEQW